jgi:hypothetical protein
LLLYITQGLGIGRIVWNDLGDGKWIYNILVGKPEAKRPRREWEDNIRMDIGETGWKAWTGCIWLMKGTIGGLL